MSMSGSKRSSVSTIRSRSTRRSSSNLALIQEQPTPPTGSPPTNRNAGDIEAASNPNTAGSPSHDQYDDTTPLNPTQTDADIKTMDANLPKMEEGEAEKKGRKRRKKEVEGWVQYARLILPHVGMVLLCVLYAIAGATIFYVVERPHELRIRNNNLNSLRRTRDSILRDLWQMSIDPLVTKNQFRRAAFEKSDAFIKVLFESLDEGGYMTPAAVKSLLTVSTIFDKDPKAKTTHGATTGAAVVPKNQTTLPDMWSYLGCLFFAYATLTTVGYGHVTPTSTEGKLLCVVFGLFGIPLTLMTIADIGKFLGEGLKRIYRLSLRFTEKIGSRCRRCCRRTGTYELQALEPKDEDAQNGNSDKNETKEKSSDIEKGEDAKESRVDENVEKAKNEAKAAEELAADVATNIPVGWIAIVIVAYTFLGAAMFTNTEPWSLLEAFYFCFMTMTTIGYGDFVPLNQTFFLITLLYIVFGLAITTMSIEQAASEYIKRIHYFGRSMQRAKEALSNVRNMISYGNWLKRRYGLTDQQIRAITHLPDFYGFDWRSGAFVPNCYKRLYFIDQRTESMLEEIFTITTESDQDIDLEGIAPTTETEFGSKRGTTGGSLAGQSFSSLQYRDGGGAWLRVRKRLMEQRRAREYGLSPSIDIPCFALRPTPTTPIDHQHPTWTEMSHLERIAAVQRARRAAGVSRPGVGPAPFNRAQTSGNLLFQRSKVGVNNNDRPAKTVGSSEDVRVDVINKQLTPVTLNHLEGAVGSLITL